MSLAVSVPKTVPRFFVIMCLLIAFAAAVLDVGVSKGYHGSSSLKVISTLLVLTSSRHQQTIQSRHHKRHVQKKQESDQGGTEL